VIPTTTPSCPSNPFTLTVFVNPKPEITAMSTVVCSGVTFEVSPMNVRNGIVPVDTRYSWETPSTSSASLVGGESKNGQNFVFGRLINNTNTPKSATYIVTPLTTGGSCQGATFTVDVLVNPTPVINAISQIVCSGYSFVISPDNLVNGIVPNNTKYTWNIPSASGTVTGGASGELANSISGRLFNQTNTTQTVTYVVTPSTIAECIGASFTINIVLRPTPVIGIVTSAICSNTPFTFIPTETNGNIIPFGTTYSWNIPSYSESITGGMSGSNQSEITGMLVNQSNIPQTATYTVYPNSSLNCLGNPFTIVITLNPGATIGTMFTTVCSGATFNVVPENGRDGIVPFGTTYRWDAPVGAGISGGLSSSTFVSAITGTITNTTGFMATATYAVTPNILNCGTSTSFSLVVSIKPVATPTSFTAIAFGGIPFEFSPVNGINGNVPVETVFSWPVPTKSVGLSGGLSGTNQPSIATTIGNGTNVDLTATFYVTPTANCGDGTPFTLTLTVKPVPSIFSYSTTVCTDVPFTTVPVDGVNGTVPSSTLFTWSSVALSQGLTLTAGGSGNNVSPITGTIKNNTNSMLTATYYVTPSNGGFSSAPFTVTVYVSPVAIISPISRTVCNGVYFSITPTHGTDGQIPESTLFTWTAPTGNGFVNGSSQTIAVNNVFGQLTNQLSSIVTVTYIVTPTTVGTCAGNAFSVTINLLPGASVNTINLTTCSGVSFGYTPVDGTDGIIPSTTVYTWSAPTGVGIADGASQNTSVTYLFGKIKNTTNTIKTASYTVTPGSIGCGNTNSFTLNVTVYPTPEINQITSTVCSGFTFTVSPEDITNGIVPGDVRYSWELPTYNANLSGGASANNQINLNGRLTNATNITQSTTYSIVPVSGACTGNNFTLVMFVNPTPVFSAMSTVVCSGVTFEVSPRDGFIGNIVPADTRYRWSEPSYSASMTGGV
ncbi:MAG: PKD-like domain-containing protein, partial [Bacteroidota bacterium]